MKILIIFVLYSNILFAQETNKSKQLEVQSGVFMYGSDIERYVPGIHGAFDLNTTFSNQFLYPDLFFDLSAGVGYGGVEDKFGIKRYKYAKFYIGSSYYFNTQITFLNPFVSAGLSFIHAELKNNRTIEGESLDNLVEKINTKGNGLEPIIGGGLQINLNKLIYLKGTIQYKLYQVNLKDFTNYKPGLKFLVGIGIKF